MYALGHRQFPKVESAKSFVSSHGRTPREERAFFRNTQTFGHGQTNWAEKCRGIWGIFGQTTVPILAMVWSIFFFLQKTLDFRPKTYNSQKTPKYDIEFKR